MMNRFVVTIALILGFGVLLSCDDTNSGASGSVAECVQANYASCVEQYGVGNCDVWLEVNVVPVGAFGIDLPWCN